MGTEFSRVDMLKFWLSLILLSLYRILIAIRLFFTPRKSKNISNQLALITGASQGLGRALAIRLAQEGCNIAIVNRNIENGRKVANEISEKFRNIKVLPFSVDVSKHHEVKKLYSDVKKTLGTVDILINNAGFLGVEHSLLEGDDEYYQNMIDVNLTAYIWTCRAFLPDMIKQKRGHIMGISSMTAYNTLPCTITYSTTKYGIKGFLTALREEMCFYGYDRYIRTSCVYPAFIETNDELSRAHRSAVKNFFSTLNDADYVADLIVRELLKNNRNIYVPRYDTLQAMFALWMPRKVKTMIMRNATTREKIEMRRKKLNLDGNDSNFVVVVE